MKVLIVDDNAAIRHEIRVTLAGVADHFSECADGAEAAEIYRSARPDFVLMDIKMPRLDGISAARTIKSEFPHARIIMVTGFDDADLRQAALQAGALDYVLKENLVVLRKILKLGSVT